MASIREDAVPKARGKAQADGFVWVSSSPSPAEVTELEGLFPEVVRIPSALLEESSGSWRRQAILARTFHRWVPPEAFIREFRRAGVSGDIQSLSLAHRCHIFRFDEPDSKNEVIGRPWVVNGQPVAIEDWRPEFVPDAVAVSTALLWVRLPSLPVEFWKDEVLMDILAPAGEFVFTDSATRLLSRGGFARACVRVDLRRPLRPGVRIQGLGAPFWQPFQFEHLDGICPSCGSIHLSGPCNPSSSTPAEEQSSSGVPFGPWMSAIRRRRPAASVQRNPSVNPAVSHAVPESSSPGSSKLNSVADGWLTPARVARRSLPKAGKTLARVVVAPGLRPASVVKDSRQALEGSNALMSVPVELDCAGFNSLMEAEANNVQSGNTDQQLSVIHKFKSNNPFALLNEGNLDVLSSAQVDVNPGPPKRARPAESHSKRTSFKSDKCKGKGTASLSCGSKDKFNQKASLNLGRGPISTASRSEKASSDQETGGLVKGAQVPMDGIPIHDTVLSRLKSAIQGQSKDPDSLDAGSQTDADVLKAVAHKDVIPRSDCNMQLIVDDCLPSGCLVESVMEEDQVGLHPNPNCK